MFRTRFVPNLTKPKFRNFFFKAAEFQSSHEAGLKHTHKDMREKDQEQNVNLEKKKDSRIKNIKE